MATTLGSIEALSKTAPIPRDLIERARSRNAAPVQPRSISPATRAQFVDPMLCRAVKELPTGPEWAYEVKLDGYRALGLKTEGHVRLFSRNGKDFSARFPSVTRALDALPDETLIDGEVVAADENGRPSFSSLQNFDRAPVFYAFDLAMLAG